MSQPVTFTLDDQQVVAHDGETIFDCAKRLGNTLPHLCSGYHQYNEAEGSCRLCVVEVEGERTLTASCSRPVQEGMKVMTQSAKVVQARKMVMELLLADHPKYEQSAEKNSHFWEMAKEVGQKTSRFAGKGQVECDLSHPALAVDLNACIHCNNCVSACRDIQHNDVLGMAFRGGRSRIIFDQADTVDASTCVACGECVQSCPTGALLPKNPQTDEIVIQSDTEKTVDSLCPFCGVGCQLSFHINDNQIIKAVGRDGPSNQNKLCVKGRFGFDYIHHPQRLTVPLIRRDDAPKNAEESVDPANPFTHFREASWEEALDRAASGLKSILDTRGGQALAGFGSAKGSNEEAYLFQKLIRTAFKTNNVDHCTRLCHASSVAALMEGIGSAAVSAPFMDALKADLIIVIGSRPEQNHPVAASYIKQAVEDGARLIVMDPRGQGLGRHADPMVQFKSGTDVALLNAMLHVIFTEDLVDHDYIEKNTFGFSELQTAIEDFSPEEMAPICGVPAETIRDIARSYAHAERSLIFWGMGVSQHIHGTDNVRALIALALTTGHIGKPGTGLHPLRGQNNVQGASDAGLIPMVFPDYKPVSDAQIHAQYEELWDAELDKEAGLTVVEIMHEIEQGGISGMYIMGENPAMSDPDVAKARQALAKLDHLVVQDIFLTETAALADVVLPASAFAEKDGTFTNTNRQVQLGRQAVNPPGEAKQDLWIINAMAQRLGLAWSYEHPQQVFSEMSGSMASLSGISWSRLENEDSITYPDGQDVLFGSGFPTETGQGRLVPTQLVAPDESPDEEYPLILTTGRMLEHWHTGAMTRRSNVLNQLEQVPVASLHPKELGARGIEPGQSIKVSSRRGEVTLKVRLDKEVPPGMVFIPFCFHEAAANLLTNAALDPYGKIPEFKTCAVNVECVDVSEL
ncbi:formate dehydrogenase subunit alpha [Neptuniibacter sp.]|uniref:formate dehydrogenase subunit alpha n=1 Tax=Neptuniibacter sp. TaxID=1962643 RepID=UPI00263244F4|nr:formate dehydrogenase subunit alpha [Neptuniibacter sp.]MCP4596442.1 formate dehydrogenase subunit alpha [Neptuniibacter sp.]